MAQADTDHLARQIGVIQTAVKRPFDPNPVNNADVVAHVAAFLDAGGTTDVRDLRYVLNPAADLAFFFDIRTAHVYTNPQNPESTEYFSEQFNQLAVHNLIFQYQGTDGFYLIFCVFTPDGYPVFYAAKRKRTSDWSSGIVAVVGVAAVAFSAAVPGLGAAIGEAVMGAEFAASYPALTAAIGNIAVSTAFNGGDIKSAMIGALTAGIGNGVGGLVTSATDSSIIGQTAAVATKAAINGGDVVAAVGQSLALQGVSSIGSLPSLGGPDMKLGDDGDYGMPAYHDQVYTDTDVAPTDYGLPYGPFGSGIDLDATYGTPATMPDYYHDPVWSPTGTAEGGSVVQANPTAPPSGPSGVVASVNGADLTKLALTGLQLVTAWKNAGSPAVRASNAAVTANADGTITTRQANGAVVTTKMPVGTPYLTTTGALVTNNGNGTYTSVNANGSISTSPYPPGTGLSSSLASITSNPTAMLGIGAVALVLLLRR